MSSGFPKFCFYFSFLIIFTGCLFYCSFILFKESSARLNSIFQFINTAFILTIFFFFTLTVLSFSSFSDCLIYGQRFFQQLTTIATCEIQLCLHLTLTMQLSSSLLSKNSLTQECVYLLILLYISYLRVLLCATLPVK